MASNNPITATLGNIDYTTRVDVDEFDFTVDEPESIGGTGKSPGPFGYLLGSLTACTAITLKMYAQRKGWDLGVIKVSADFAFINTEDGQKRVIKKSYSFEKAPTEEQRKRLMIIAEKCPVSKMLKSGVEMEATSF
ncbi:MAG: OsmC family protein [Saprospiraceae bacterium]|nr:OsmC family protein [Saprospiraceae bacterium]